MKKPKLSLEALTPLIEKIEKLSTVQRILIYAGSFLVLVGAVVYFLYMPKWDMKNELQTEFEDLSNKLMIARKNAAKLPKLRAQMKLAQLEFAEASKALPERRELPSLLTSVSQSGGDAGLEFQLFQPSGEINKQFYTEIPVAIRVQGGYHNTAEFFDRVAALSRIVTIKDIAIVPGQKDKLSISCSAVTYKFIEQSEQKGS
ncbi:MAG: type 4a pilus biogenesis protein PilO [Desulfobacterales bacterium]|nr:type 4a pilus biogenesis protein PilO [Desulfobacterales bacterium]